MTIKTLEPKAVLSPAGKIMAAAVIFYALGVLAFGLLYVNISSFVSNNSLNVEALSTFDYLIYLILGLTAITIAFLISLSALSQSKEQLVVFQFILILISWVIAIMLSGAIHYLVTQAIITFNSI